MIRVYQFAFFSLLCLITFSIKAQDLANRIPADARIVASIKAKNLTQLLSIKDFNTTSLGKKLLEGSTKKLKTTLNEVEDFGIDLESNFYYYNQSNDSISYNCFLIPLKNSKQFDQLFINANKGKITVEGNIRTAYDADSGGVSKWNNNMLFFAKADVKYSYFEKEDVAKRFGLNYYPIDTVAPAAGTDSTYYDDQAATDTTYDEEPMAESPDNWEDDSDTVQTDESPVTEFPIYTKRTVQDSVKTIWLAEMVQNAITSPVQKSILSNTSYLTSLDDNAEGTFWVANTDELFTGFFSSFYLKNMKLFNGYKSFNAKLYLEKEDIRLATAIELNEDMASSYEKITKSKLNKKFLKYVNEDKMLGYTAFSMNTKAYLDQYPKVISKVYGSVFADEADMFADLFSLVVDEKAIDKAFKGDGLFLLNGLSQKEVTYKTYDYDEDFNSKEVEKTKTETVPDFLFMTSTKDDRLLKKLLSYAEKKKALNNNGSFYKLALPKVSNDYVPLYFMIKQGIVFLGSNEKDMRDIADNKFNTNLSKFHKSLMLKNNFSSYLSAEKLSLQMPKEGLTDSVQLKNSTFMLGATGDVVIKTNKLKNNTLTSDMSVKIRNEYPNSLQYLFSLIEKTIKKDD